MIVLFTIIAICSLSWILRNILFWVSLWQLKEYRLDRVLIHLRETRQGRDLLYSKTSFFKWLGILMFLTSTFFSLNPFSFQLFIFCLYVYQLFFLAREFRFRQIRRPIFTVKAAFITICTICIVLILFSIPIIDHFMWVVILDRLTPFVVWFLVFLLSIPTELLQDYKLEKAIEKLRKYEQIKVIGITGSYGKSSTKEYVAQVLTKKFILTKTKGTNNTPIGIAQAILSSITARTQIFVVEMGAYKIGEIEQMCAMIRPTIGILTAVNEQHLSLFGSLENTKKAKYELIDSLPKNGIGLFNGNNDNVLDLYKKSKKKKILYMSFPTDVDYNNWQYKNVKVDIAAVNISSTHSHISFDVILNNQKFFVRAPLLGPHNVQNILPAIYVASILGMTTKEIQDAVLNLSSLESTMSYHKTPSGIVLIDDTFNANPQAIFAALSYMNLYNGRKFLVLQPMIELGRNAQEEHIEIGKQIGKNCDVLLVTNKNFLTEITYGVKESKGKCKVMVFSPSEVVDYINEHAKKGDVIVFEGKESKHSLTRLK